MTIGGRRITKGVVIAVSVAVIALVLLVEGFAAHAFTNKTPKHGKYQAVFLTNGQVYFGKLSGIGGKSVTLKDVYLVQSQNGNNASPSPSSLVLARIDQNTLIHPYQEMTIDAKQVLFWEDMQDDAEVVKKINDDKGKK